MSERLRLRRATAADAPALWPLCVEHARHEQLPDVAAWADDTTGPARLAQAISTGALHIWLVLNTQGQPQGYASAREDFATLGATPFIHLDALYLLPGLRGQGLGRRLMQTVADWALAQGCSALQWQTPTWNEPAIGFYRALGATDASKQRFFWHPAQAGV